MVSMSAAYLVGFFPWILSRWKCRSGKVVTNPGVAVGSLGPRLMTLNDFCCGLVAFLGCTGVFAAGVAVTGLTNTLGWVGIFPCMLALW